MRRIKTFLVATLVALLMGGVVTAEEIKSADSIVKSHFADPKTNEPDFDTFYAKIKNMSEHGGVDIIMSL